MNLSDLCGRCQAVPKMAYTFLGTTKGTYNYCEDCLNRVGRLMWRENAPGYKVSQVLPAQNTKVSTPDTGPYAAGLDEWKVLGRRIREDGTVMCYVGGWKTGVFISFVPANRLTWPSKY